MTAFAAACSSGDGSAEDGPLPTATSGLPVIELRYPGGALRVEVATTPDERAQGLSDRDALDANAGMLFVLEGVRVPSFWMRGMRFPLDMIWVGEDQRIAGVTANVQPQPGVATGELATYSPDVPVRYVLEVNAGAARRLGLGPGDELTFALP